MQYHLVPAVYAPAYQAPQQHRADPKEPEKCCPDQRSCWGLCCLFLLCALCVAVVAVVLTLEPGWVHAPSPHTPQIDVYGYPPVTTPGAGNGVNPTPATGNSGESTDSPGSSGIYVPSGWGSNWYSALYNTQSPRWMWLGDDASAGLGASIPAQYNVGTLINAGLQSDFSSPISSGMRSIAASDVTSNPVLLAYTARQLGMSTLGTDVLWNTRPAAWDGGQSLYASTDVAQMVFYGNGSRLELRLPVYTNTPYGFTLTIDTGAPVSYTVPISGSTGSFTVMSFNLPAPGEHRVLFVAQTFGYTGLVSASFVEDVGPRIYNLAGYAWTAGNLAYKQSYLGTGGSSDLWDASLRVFAMGYYSALLETPDGVLQVLQGALGYWPLAIDVLIVRPYIANDTTAMIPIVANYLNQTQWLTTYCVSISPKCAIIDFVELWGGVNNYQMLRDLGWMGNATNNGQAGSSSYTFSDLGYIQMTSQLYGLITQQILLPWYY